MTTEQILYGSLFVIFWVFFIGFDWIKDIRDETRSNAEDIAALKSFRLHHGYKLDILAAKESGSPKSQLKPGDRVEIVGSNEDMVIKQYFRIDFIKGDIAELITINPPHPALRRMLAHIRYIKPV